MQMCIRDRVCKGIRECIAEIYDDATAAAIRIQYGGSVNAKTAPELFAQENIDGGQMCIRDSRRAGSAEPAIREKQKQR